MEPIDFRAVFKAVATVGLWYACNISVSLSNRYLLTSGLRAPISLACLHMLCTFCFASLAVSHLGFEKQYIQSRKQFWKVMVQSLTFGLSVVCGVSALGFIPVSFNEMISATTPLFTALLSYSIQGETQTYERAAALIFVALGAIISSGGEPSWNTIGFLLSLTATATRGLKSVLQAVLLTNTEEKLSSMNLLRYMSGIVFLILIPIVLVTDGPMKVIDVFASQYQQGNFTFLYILGINIFAAFMLNLSQFLVTLCVGAVILQVLGNFKGVVNSCISIAIFHNQVTMQTIGGYGITTFGVFLYTYLKKSQKKDYAKGTEAFVQQTPLLPKQYV